MFCSTRQRFRAVRKKNVIAHAVNFLALLFRFELLHRPECARIEVAKIL